MRSSRAPEGRSSNKRYLLFAMGIAAIAAIIAGIFFSVGSDSLSAKDDQAKLALETASASTIDKANSTGGQSVGEQSVALEPTSTPAPIPTLAPTSSPTQVLAASEVPAPAPTATPVPEPVHTEANSPAPQPTPAPTALPAARTVPAVFPDAQFGEVLEEGLMDLKFPQGELVKTWYTFQVDTKTRDITLFFAQYDDALESILTTIKIDNYQQGIDLAAAEVMLSYPDGSTRQLIFDGTEGTITLSQQYTLPVGPSMFSSGLRRALVYYGMSLRDETGDIEVELHLDLSGLSQSEGLDFKRLVPGTVDDVLSEIQVLVEQIEDKRLQP